MLTSDESGGCIGNSRDLLSDIIAIIGEVEMTPKACRLIQLYSNEPFALDHIIPAWMSQFVDKFRQAMNGGNADGMGAWASLIYVLINVRGLPFISSFFPSDIDTLVDVLEYAPFIFSSPDREDSLDWMVKYVLWGWLALLAKIPLDLKGFLGEKLWVEFTELATLGRELMDKRRPEAVPITRFLTALCSRPDCTAVISDIVDWAVASTHWELVYRLLKVGHGMSGSILERLLSSVKNARSADGRFQCKLLAQLYKKSLHEDANQQIVQSLCHVLVQRDIALREQAAKCLSKMKVGLLECSLDTILRTRLNEHAVPILHGHLMLVGRILHAGHKPNDVTSLSDALKRTMWFEWCRGTFAVGSVVRDASCYVAWSWARTAPESIDPSLPANLLMLALFDREVSLRRAAAAAFQEVVGRRGNGGGMVRDAMDLMRRVNFYSVSQRPACVEAIISIHSSHPEYKALIEERIMDGLVGHWDVAMRKMAAQLMHLLNEEHAVSELLQMAANPIDLFRRHGALLCLAQFRDKRITEFLEAPALLYDPKDMGADLVLEGVLLNAANYPATSLTLARIEDGLRSRNSALQEAAVHALQSSSCHDPIDQALLCPFFQQMLPRADKVERGVGKTGFSRALGSIPPWLAATRLPSYWRLSWRIATRSEEPSMHTRLAALRACCDLATRHAISAELWRIARPALTALSSDYTIDAQEGDTGSWLREGVMPLIVMYVGSIMGSEEEDDDDDDDDDERDRRECVEMLWEQAVGRLDRVRRAGVAHLRKLHIDIPDDPFEHVLATRCLTPGVVRGLRRTVGGVDGRLAERARQCLALL